MIIEDVNGKRPRNLLLSIYLTKIARLGGYLGRAKDRPPGNLVMWGAGCHASLTSNSALLSPLDLWVIESMTVRLQEHGFEPQFVVGLLGELEANHHQ